MAEMITLALLVSAALKHWFGQPGRIAISLFAGFADVHAPTIAVATLAAKHSLTHSEAIVPILDAYSGHACSKALVALFKWQPDILSAGDYGLTDTSGCRLAGLVVNLDRVLVIPCDSAQTVDLPH